MEILKAAWACRHNKVQLMQVSSFCIFYKFTPELIVSNTGMYSEFEIKSRFCYPMLIITWLHRYTPYLTFLHYSLLLSWGSDDLALIFHPAVSAFFRGIFHPRAPWNPDQIPSWLTQLSI